MTTPSSKASWPNSDADSNWTGLDSLSKFKLQRHNYFTSKGETKAHSIDLKTNKSEFSFKIKSTHETEEEFESKE